MKAFPHRLLLCGFTALSVLISAQGADSAAQPPIDRAALVQRHSPTMTKVDPLSPLSVGNGEIGYTVDITGLQTFPEAYEQGMPLHTQSQWGWHSFPNTHGYKLEDTLTEYEFHGRKVTYADGTTPQSNGDYVAAANYLRANPHRLDLGRLGLILRKANGEKVALADLTDTRQALDLWRGVLVSEFKVEGQQVKVETLCHPERDVIAVRIESPLLRDGRLSVSLAFPFAAADWKATADWTSPEKHETTHTVSGQQARFERTLDNDKYFVTAAWSDGASLKPGEKHHYEITAPEQEVLEVRVAFTPEAQEGNVASFAESKDAAERWWKTFWSQGGAIDFSGSTDPRAQELERRIVLSQYQTAINCSGSAPPQETGLVRNSWFGKPHLEMYWWHSVHFALWGRPQLMERSLEWYRKILPVAQENAARNDFQGARWPKMVGPDGRDSPSTIAVFLIWQQPHPIYCAELLYRAEKDKAVLEKWKEIVFQSAEFMTSFAAWEEVQQRYVLGPVIIPAQESYGKWRRTVLNPTYELAYWHWALEIAQQWRTRLGMEREPAWDKVIQNLPKPLVRDGVYAAIETEPFTITEDHPSMLCALGVLPQTPLIDPAIMNKTYDHVLKAWDWPSTWGWDYPVMAMTAARLGRGDAAVDALLVDTQKNTYLANGHNYQDARLPLYLPGNGGLLTAVAMMATGWDGAPSKDAPGFPKDGTWKVRHEGLAPMP